MSSLSRTEVTVKATLVVVVLSLVCAPLGAGIRGPGKYSGVVFFDRWDTCVLISGVYVMYISDRLKSGLRSFAGQAVEIDASDVFQPVNPGDGLIRKYNWIGLAPEPRRYIQLDGLKLTAESNPAQGPSSVVVEILNTGISVVRVSTAEIGINVFGIKREGTADVSDGRSEAVITRAHLQRSLGQFLDTNENGSRFHASFEANNSIPDTIRLEPGAAYRVIIKFDLSPGEYQFVFGYGGGVHEERALLSNGVSFDVTSEAARP